MTRNFLIVGLAAALAVPVLAQTAPVAPTPPAPPVAPTPPMRAMMADKVMTRAEVQTMVQGHFARMDANRDGAITADEMQPRRARPEGAPMAARDPNAAFDRLDSNRDGMISRDEFARGHAIRIEKRAEMRGAPGMHGQHRGMRMMHRMHGMGGARMLRDADLNKDGRITLQEANGAALRHFDQVDANRDGRITPEERRAAHRQHGLRKAG